MGRDTLRDGARSMECRAVSVSRLPQVVLRRGTRGGWRVEQEPGEEARKRPKLDALAVERKSCLGLLRDAATNDTRQPNHARAQQYQTRRFGHLGAEADQRSGVITGGEAALDDDLVGVRDVMRNAVVEEGDGVTTGNERMPVSVDRALVEVAIERAGAQHQVTAVLVHGPGFAGAEKRHEAGERIVDQTMRGSNVSEELRGDVSGEVDQTKVARPVGIAVDVEDIAVGSESKLGNTGVAAGESRRGALAKRQRNRVQRAAEIAGVKLRPARVKSKVKGILVLSGRSRRGLRNESASLRDFEDKPGALAANQQVAVGRENDAVGAGQ